MWWSALLFILIQFQLLCLWLVKLSIKLTSLINYCYELALHFHRTFPSGVLFSTQISSAGLSAGFPDVGTGGIPGGNSIPGGGGRLPTGGGRNGGLCSGTKRNKHAEHLVIKLHEVRPKWPNQSANYDCAEYRKVLGWILSEVLCQQQMVPDEFVHQLSNN